MLTFGHYISGHHALWSKEKFSWRYRWKDTWSTDFSYLSSCKLERWSDLKSLETFATSLFFKEIINAKKGHSSKVGDCNSHSGLLYLSISRFIRPPFPFSHLLIPRLLSSSPSKSSLYPSIFITQNTRFLTFLQSSTLLHQIHLFICSANI